MNGSWQWSMYTALKLSTMYGCRYRVFGQREMLQTMEGYSIPLWVYHFERAEQ